MDNIAQSMRFSPTRGVVCRNEQPELAFERKRLELSGEKSVASYFST
jgi:hypothetical protein